MFVTGVEFVEIGNSEGDHLVEDLSPNAEELTSLPRPAISSNTSSFRRRKISSSESGFW